MSVRDKSWEADRLSDRVMPQQLHLHGTLWMAGYLLLVAARTRPVP